MAEKLGGSTWNIPGEGKVIDSPWEDDIDVEYATYGSEKEEKEYISPNKVITKDAQKKIDRIKAKKIAVKVGQVLELQSV